LIQILYSFILNIQTNKKEMEMMPTIIMYKWEVVTTKDKITTWF